MNLLDKLLYRLYAFMCGHGRLVQNRVKIDLEYLYPGANQEELCRNYYVKKMRKSLLIFFGGSLLAGMLALKASGQRQMEQDSILQRGSALEETQNVMVEAVLDGEKDRFQLQMQPLQLGTEEVESSYLNFCSVLSELIAGENPSLQKVTKDLNLLERYEGYPFEVDWRSGNVDAVTSAGIVKPGEQETEVSLTARISYGEQEWEQVLAVKVLPEELTSEQRKHKNLEKMLLAAEETSRMEEFWVLPENLEGVPIKWRRVVGDDSLILWVGALAVSVLIYAMGDKDLHGELEKQRECMKREYPDIVHKLALYIGAGMTLQGAFQRIAAEYEQRRSGGGKREPAYEEMLYACRELKSGVSEADAYAFFGKRTGLQEYIRLSTLMTQNLKKGSNSLLSRLQEEADRSLTERIQMGRKLGEETSTKLLVPMVLMLLVVMIMVMLPAFSSMGM